uniref:Putative secreted protein n=1 Tax=Rhipicephalus microplus TaxID=6941 RepID=A0A6G5A326_RHIMP
MSGWPATLQALPLSSLRTHVTLKMPAVLWMAVVFVEQGSGSKCPMADRAVVELAGAHLCRRLATEVTALGGPGLARLEDVTPEAAVVAAPAACAGPLEAAHSLGRGAERAEGWPLCRAAGILRWTVGRLGKQDMQFPTHFMSDFIPFVSYKFVSDKES